MGDVKGERMLVREAMWLADQMQRIDADRLFPLLNVGSQTEDFRKIEQPWIDQYIFAPFRTRSYAVSHLDLQAGTGVDIVGDLGDPAFLRMLKSLKFKSVLCSNLLEHVVNRQQVAEALIQVVPVGGFIILSVPFRFPYHPDPIDTLFRPDPEELAALFPGTSIWRREIVDGGNLTAYVFEKLKTYPVGRLGNSSRKRETLACMREVTARLRLLTPWLFRSFKVTCLVLEKR